MAKELLAGGRKDQYKIIIGQNAISKKNLTPLIKDHKKILLISDSGVPKKIIKDFILLSKARSKVFTIILDQGEYLPLDQERSASRSRRTSSPLVEMLAV